MVVGGGGDDHGKLRISILMMLIMMMMCWAGEVEAEMEVLLAASWRRWRSECSTTQAPARQS